jgi:hypothetical protein
MLDRDFWELASFVITALGLPLAIAIFLYEQRKERRNEEYEAYQLLSDAYNDFLKIVIDNPDLRLRTRQTTQELNAEQNERLRVILDMLIALFERAYLTAWSPRMSAEQRRRWNSWEDFMRDWIRRDDFYYRLPELLRGEDPEFVAYLRKLAEDERGVKLPA